VRLSSIKFWEGIDYIIKTVEPIYKMLRFADQDKKPNVGDVVMAYQQMKAELCDTPRFLISVVNAND
jgi:hypothetical protein